MKVALCNVHTTLSRKHYDSIYISIQEMYNSSFKNKFIVFWSFVGICIIGAKHVCANQYVGK